LNRVVITGLGVVSSVGQSTQDYWDSLIAGRSAFALPTLGTAAQASGKLVGEVKGFEPATHFESSQVPLLDRVSQFAIVAVRQAVSQSGLALRAASLPSELPRSSELDRADIRPLMKASTVSMGKAPRACIP
jgi:3-oxoacyl-(acyl-carrier-protein) synthase